MLLHVKNWKSDQKWSPFLMCKIRNNYCKTAIHTKIAEKFYINGN